MRRMHIRDDDRAAIELRLPAGMDCLKKRDIVAIVHRCDRFPPVQRRRDDLVPTLHHDIEEDAVALGAVRRGDEFAGSENLLGIVQCLIGVVNDEH